MVIFNRAKGEVSNLCMPGKFIDEVCENQHSPLSTKDALESNSRLSQLRNNLQEVKQYLLPDTHLSDNQVSSIGGGQVLY